MINIIENLIFRLRCFRENTTIPFSTRFIHPRNIYLGRDCVVDTDCYFKAGKDKRPYILIGNKVVIKSRSRISTTTGLIEISDFCYLGQNMWMGGKGNISIKKNSIFAMNVVIISSNHDYMNIPTPYYEGIEIRKDITIGENVWVGANSVILPGVTIEDGSVISAGSVVHGVIPKNSIASGNPAKVIHEIVRS